MGDDKLVFLSKFPALVVAESVIASCQLGLKFVPELCRGQKTKKKKTLYLWHTLISDNYYCAIELKCPDQNHAHTYAYTHIYTKKSQGKMA